MAGALRRGAGGIAGLVRLLEEHGEAIEWDLPHYWPGRSLMELYRGDMSWRELRVFIEGLPQDSRTMRALHPKSEDDELWTFDRHLAAMAIDELRLNTFALLKLHGDPKKTRRLKAPKPIPRPGVTGDTDNVKTIRFGGRHGSGAKGLAAAFGAPKAS